MVYGDNGKNKQTFTDAAKLCAERGAQLIKITKFVNFVVNYQLSNDIHCIG